MLYAIDALFEVLAGGAQGAALLLPISFKAYVQSLNHLGILEFALHLLDLLHKGHLPGGLLTGRALLLHLLLTWSDLDPSCRLIVLLLSSIPPPR